MTGRLFAAFAVFSALIYSTAALADAVEVDAELVLAVDVSRSMTARELEIQRRGYAEALKSPEVAKAITSGLLGRIAITYIEWSGAHEQRVIVDWTIIDGGQSAAAFADKLTIEFNEALRRTSISGAINFARRSLDENNYVSNRRIIDISGDGPNNQGLPVTAARDAALGDGIIINGLPLMTREGMGSQFHLDDLDEYYRNCVIGGPGSFVIPVHEWSEFPGAVRQKLILELAGGAPEPYSPSVRKAQFSGSNCLVGEMIWNDFIRYRFFP